MLIQPMPLAATAAALRRGEFDLIAYYDDLLNRLETVDHDIQAFVPHPQRREQVMQAAQALQNQYPDPADRPPLYGIPLGVKDIYRVDGWHTTGGSALPPEALAGPEASCVSIFKQNGAIVLGKTVTTEFAYFEPGPTRNPHHLEHTPGGSSSGSAAAVAAGLCALSIGTQTVGSVIRPAAFCGVVGYKPSYGRIDPTGVIYFSQSLDHVGLFTQDVAGMKIAASHLCRDWQRMNSTVGELPVLGVPDGPFLDQASSEALRAFDMQINRLTTAGYTVRRASVLDDIAEIGHRHRELMAFEMAQNHADWFAEFEERYRPRTVEIIRQGQQVKWVAVRAAIAGQETARRELETAMADTGIDIWISPAAPGPAPTGIASTGDPAMNLPWTHTGLPTVTIPAGKSANGLPLGLQCASAFWNDEALLDWCTGLYRALND